MGIKFVEHCLAQCDRLAAEAAYLVDPSWDEVELKAFAARLCGMEGLDYDGMLERVAGVEIPGDFRHLRVTNLSTDMPWGGIFSIRQEALRLDRLLLHMACTVDLGRATPCGSGGVWTETVALPIKDPGVLELGVVFRPRS